MIHCTSDLYVGKNDPKGGLTLFRVFLVLELNVWYEKYST